MHHLNQFAVSKCKLDHVLILRVCEIGVWTIVRCSSIVKLFDAKSLACTLAFDMKTSQNLNIDNVRTKTAFNSKMTDMLVREKKYYF